jgi:U3 small nucleolar ribonucleoprotein component
MTYGDEIDNNDYLENTDERQLDDLSQVNKFLFDFPDSEEASANILKEIERSEWNKVPNKSELNELARMNGFQTFRSWQRFWKIELKRSRLDRKIQRLKE